MLFRIYFDLSLVLGVEGNIIYEIMLFVYNLEVEERINFGIGDLC